MSERGPGGPLPSTTGTPIGRIRHRAEFADLRRRGTRGGSGPVSVTYAGDPPPAGLVARPGSARVAFAIPRRVGKAVVRNRVRRRLRSIFAEAGPERAPAGAYLVAGRPGIAELTYRELAEHVHRALNDIASRSRRPVATDGGPRP